MATSLSTLVFTQASAAAYAKGRGVTLLGFALPAAVNNSAASIGLEASFDGGTTYYDTITDVSGTATNYRPQFAVSKFLVLDPTIIHALEEASHVRVTLYATDGSTAASQTATTLGVVTGKITP